MQPSPNNGPSPRNNAKRTIPTTSHISHSLSRAISLEEASQYREAYACYLKSLGDLVQVLGSTGSPSHTSNRFHLEMLRNCTDRIIHLAENQFPEKPRPHTTFKTNSQPPRPHHGSPSQNPVSNVTNATSPRQSSQGNQAPGDPASRPGSTHSPMHKYLIDSSYGRKYGPTEHASRNRPQPPSVPSRTRTNDSTSRDNSSRSGYGNKTNRGVSYPSSQNHPNYNVPSRNQHSSYPQRPPSHNISSETRNSPQIQQRLINSFSSLPADPPRKLVSQWSSQFDLLNSSSNKSTLSVDSFVKKLPFLNLNPFAARLFYSLNHSMDREMEELQFKESLKILTHGSINMQWQMGFSFFDQEGRGFVNYDTFRNVMLSLFEIIEYMVQLNAREVFAGNGARSAPNMDHSAMSTNVPQLNVSPRQRKSHPPASQIQYSKEQIVQNLFRKMCSSSNVVTRTDYEHFVQTNPLHIQTLGVLDVMSLRQSGHRISSKLGFPVSFGHRSWNRVLIMMAGIERSIISTPGDLSSVVSPSSGFMTRFFSAGTTSPSNTSAFKDRQEFLLPSVPSPSSHGGSGAEASGQNTKFTSIAPRVFRELRQIFGVTEAQYRFSFGLEQMFGHLLCGQLSTLSEKVTEGKSGNFFFCTHDARFMAKTISTEEYDAFKSILPQYYSYLRDNPNSLISRMYALYKLNDTPFIVMETAFKTSNSIDVTFDLKGSTYKRRNGPEASLQKDLDWREQHRQLDLHPDLMTPFMEQLNKDVEFLRSLDIIDYSLIVGVSERNPAHYNTPAERSIFQRHSGGCISADGSRVYYVGIIDCLITYGVKKRLEKYLKAVYTGNEDAVSVTDPSTYAERFLEFMKSTVKI